MPTLAATAVLLCVGFAAAALAASSPPHRPPAVLSVSAPGEVTSGTPFSVRGRVAHLGTTGGQVVVQVDQGGGWRAIGRARVVGRRFEVSCSLTGEGEVRLRAALRSSSGSSVRSASRRLEVRPAPAPATQASQPSPPPAATTQVAPAPPVEPPTPEAPPVADYYWGAWFDGNPAPEDTAARERFEGRAGKPLSIMESFSPWAICSSGNACAPNQAFPLAILERIRARGAIPMYSWASEANGSPEEPEYQLADVISGRYDTYIREWAEEAKAWGHPFFLRFDWEMNGNWYPWGEKINGNTPGEFVTAWRHVHDIFAAVGATNVSWLWCPFANPNGNLPATSGLFPGNSYVDWTGIDGYNRGTSSPNSRWRTFSEIIGPDYATISSLAPSKPMLLPEVSSSESGGSKAAWIEEMFAQLPVAFPDVRGFLWFDHEEDGHGWPIETSASATEAFATGIADPRYLSNSLASLPDGPVPVPPG